MLRYANLLVTTIVVQQWLTITFQNSAYFHAVYNSMVNLTVYLLKLYGLSCTTYTVMGHSELYAKGLGSSSADPMQWFPKHGKSMNTFRADVRARM